MEINSVDDLEDYVGKLIESQENLYKGSLEEYLSALLVVVDQHRDRPVTFSLIAALIEEAFSVNPAPFQAEWLKYQAPPDQDLIEDDFEILKQTLLFHISELHIMAEDALKNEYRYYGIESPTGHTWYNFDPFNYLSGGMGGFQTYCENCQDRSFGTISISRGVLETNWATLAHILECGRIYE